MLEQLIRNFFMPLAWLLEPFCKYGMFYYDRWSLVHFWSGIMILTALSVMKVNNRWLKLFGILVLWEVFEQGLVGYLFALFLRTQGIATDEDIYIQFERIFCEYYIDTLNDITIGLLGGWVIDRLFRWKRLRPHIDLFTIAFTATTISFITTGQHGAMPVLLFFAAGMAIIFVFKMFAKENTPLKACALTWLLYLPLWGGGCFLFALWEYSFLSLIAPCLLIWLYLNLRKLFGSFMPSAHNHEVAATS